MRDIKFRVWNGEEMFLPQDISRIDNNRGGRASRVLMFDGREVFLTADDAFLMQYMDLKDSCGEELCEGDVVEYVYPPKTGVKPCLREVTWDLLFGSLKDMLLLIQVTIVGNVHEGLDLVERAKCTICGAPFNPHADEGWYPLR